MGQRPFKEVCIADNGGERRSDAIAGEEEKEGFVDGRGVGEAEKVDRNGASMLDAGTEWHESGTKQEVDAARAAVTCHGN